MRVNTLGIKGEKKMQYITDAFSEPKEEWAASSSAYITGISASIAGQMLARREVKFKGVLPPEACIEPKIYMKELIQKNVTLQEIAVKTQLNLYRYT